MLRIKQLKSHRICEEDLLEEAYSIADIINEENENFINESGLDRIFEVEDKEIQKKLLRKIMYITYLNGLGEDAQTMALKCIIKMIGNKM